MKAKQIAEDSVLVDAAKVIGRTAGKVAVLVGAAHAPAAKPRAGKFVKKDKHKLPRRQKKAHLRAAAKSPV